MASNRAGMGGNPRRSRMLSGRIFCPCGHPAVFRPGCRPSAPDNYQCGQARNAQNWGKAQQGNDSPCDKTFYRVDIAEAATASAFLSAARNPQALADARQMYAQKQESKARALTPNHGGDVRTALSGLDRALEQLAQQETAAVQAQISGIMAGASPDAYAAAFADIAARRKDMEDQRGRLARSLTAARPSTGRTKEKPLAPAAMETKALEDAALVLTSPDVPGETKRDIVGMVIRRVVCQKDGAAIYFLPGFGEGSFHEGEPYPETCQSVQALQWLPG